MEYHWALNLTCNRWCTAWHSGQRRGRSGKQSGCNPPRWRWGRQSGGGSHPRWMPRSPRPIQWFCQFWFWNARTNTCVLICLFIETQLRVGWLTHARILPLYRVIKVVMWFFITLVSVFLSVMELTHEGSCECHTWGTVNSVFLLQ